MSARQAISAAGAGVLFGAGLSHSGMANPAKVIGFLDVTGNWDPSLAFVMAGALIPAVLAFHLVRREGRIRWQKAPLSNTRITPSLVLGAVLFGVGWGLAGFCPGPALVSLAFGQVKPAAFVAAMLAGILLHKLVFLRRGNATATTEVQS